MPVSHYMPTLGLTRRDLRLASGLVLFAYLAFHLVNHALGLISLDVAERGLRVAVAVWHSPAGTLLLYGAAATHIALAFISLYQRRTLRMPRLEALRIALGLWMPVALISHAVATRIAYEAYGAAADYSRIVWGLWHSNREGRQMALLVPGWLHGCLGLRFAFGRRGWYQRLRPFLFGSALLLPVLAVLGFLSMLKEVALRAQDPLWFNASAASLTDAGQTHLAQIAEVLLSMYVAAIVAVLLARVLRYWIESRGGRLVAITYPGRTIRVPRGWTVLEASRSHHIPHLSMCGGNARCSTCRVRVEAGGERCPPPSTNELHTLHRIHAPDDVRLACQLRPEGDVAVVPLLLADAPKRTGFPVRPVERQLAVMIVSFHVGTAMRTHLPHDLLHVLNAFSELTGDTLRGAGGIPTTFSGNSVTAFFGAEVDLHEAARQALSAASHLDLRLCALSDRLRGELGWSAEFVVHLHAGSAAIGETGDSGARTPTVVGDVLDVLQQLAVQQSAPHLGRIVCSEAFASAAALDMAEESWRETVLSDRRRFRVALISPSARGEIRTRDP